MKLVFRILSLAFVLSFFCIGGLQAQIQDGKGIFEFSGYAPMKEKKLRIFYYKPEGDVTKMPILFVMHGVLRNADTYRDNWVELAEAHKVLVIVPEFNKKDFPGSRSYNYGNLLNRDRTQNPEASWSYSLIDPIFYRVLEITGSEASGYDIFGHSAGSQFVHRFMLFKGSDKVHRILAANAGSYTMPTMDVDFPFGLNGTDYNKDQLKRALALKMVVHLGEADVDTTSKHFPKGAGPMRQGKTRYERGWNFYKMAKALAEKEGMEFNWIVRTVPGVGHDNGKMAVDAAEFLYGSTR